ncbi:hypothetical protein EIP86_006343 [Pleurotus ostreatoroseus]|nr:hypothetical protein EIP86_006343 [Pleurotus ostreatoroseus]
MAAAAAAAMLPPTTAATTEIELTEELKREIGQHFVFGFHGQDAPEGSDVARLITEYYVGVGARDSGLGPRDGRARTVVRRGGPGGMQAARTASASLLSTTSRPGPWPLVQPPGALPLSASRTPALAEHVATATGEELRMAGVHWVFAPVVDVCVEPENAVVGTLTIVDCRLDVGVDPESVAAFASATCDGLTKAGLAPAPKHFPGHGRTRVDSHLALPTLALPPDPIAAREELERCELVPFRRLVREDVPSIMTGHLAVPALTGSAEPASLSRALTTGLLRGELGFEGVVVTDCLEMASIADPREGGCGVEEGAVRALEAGADVVMACHTFERQRGAVEAVYAAVRSGRLPVQALKASGERVGKMKARFTKARTEFALGGAFDVERWEAHREAHGRLRRRAYVAGVAVVSDVRGVLPLKRAGEKGPVVVFTPRMESVNLAVDDAEGVLRDVGAVAGEHEDAGEDAGEGEGVRRDAHGRVRNTAGPSYYAFAAAIAARAPAQHVVYAPEHAHASSHPPASQHGHADKDVLAHVAGRAGAVVFATRNGFGAGAWQRACLERVCAGVGAGVPVVVVSTCAPYDVLEMREEIGLGMGESGTGEGESEGTDGAVRGAAVCATMEFTAAALETMAEVIFGEAEAGGVVPVGLHKH